MKKIEKHDDVFKIWEAYKSGLTSYILKRVKNQEITKDVAQDVLMKVYKSCCSGIEIQNFRSWLFQIAHNTIMDYFKKESRYADEIIDMVEEYECHVYKEVENFIEPLLKLLPSKYAIPLNMCDLEGLNQSEIALKLDLSLSGTKSRIQRARTMLKEKIIMCSNIKMDAKGYPVLIEFRSDCKPLFNQIKK